MKNEVRPIDANATIEALRANFQQGSWYGCEDPLYQIAEDTIAEMPTILHTASGEPLTLEQLREMDGQPVWVHVIDHTVFADKEDDFDGWGMCRKSWVRIWDSKRADIVHIDYDFEDYGKDWIAYAYPPARIDREAWKCPLCERSKVISFEAWEDESKFPKGPSVRGAALFCPHCGKPRTPEAWAELEKRMGV